MLEVTSSKIENFVENFLNAAMFNELPGEQQDSLKEFLTEYLIRLYKDNTDNIISLLEQLETINPFMIKMALGYGLLEEDVVELIRILFMKINEYFYKQGSFELIKNLRRIFEYYGISSKIYKIIYDKNNSQYLMKNIDTGEQEPASLDEIITPGHIVHKSDYSASTFVDKYDTIVIYISLELYAQVDERMVQPTALLHAYTITIHQNDIIPFFIDGMTYDLPLKQYLDFLRYYYLRYLEVKYSNFELNESGLEMWNLFITDENDLNNAESLLTDLLDNGFASRDGLAYYIRMSTYILNKYKFQTTPQTIESIRQHVYNLNNNLAEAIDQLGSENDFISNIVTMSLYFEEYLASIVENTTLEKFVKKTIRYLFMYVMLALVGNFSNQIRKIVAKYKRYYLPIYTQFIYDDTAKFKIRNDFFRLFFDDNYKILLTKHATSLIETRDGQILSFNRWQKDYLVDILDSFYITVGAVSRDQRLEYNDNLHSQINSSLIENNQPNDNLIDITSLTRSDNTDILDNVVITIE